MNKLVRITEKDMVAVALQPLAAGSSVSYGAGEVTLLSDLPMGHKVALRDIRTGEPVIKYGFPIGEATEDIPRGAHVHTHNLHTLLSGAKEYGWTPTHPAAERREPAVFPGYPRKRGRPGIRNELWIIPTVGCVNDIAKALARQAQQFVGGAVEGVYAFPHPYGCSQLGDDQDNTRKVLASLATHPNAGGVLLLGLGCENSGVEQIKPYMGDYDESRVRFLISRRSQMRRLGRAFRHYREPHDRRVQRSADRNGRQHNPDRSARNVRRGNHPDEPLRKRRAVPKDGIADQRFQGLL